MPLNVPSNWREVVYISQGCVSQSAFIPDWLNSGDRFCKNCLKVNFKLKKKLENGEKMLQNDKITRKISFISYIDKHCIETHPYFILTCTYTL